MKWVLITGGVCSGIGKGCVAAMVARACVRAGQQATYRKLEPCLQGEISEFPNTHFGEILNSDSGHSFDGDVARAAFYVPGFSPLADSDLSLGRLLGRLLENSRGLPAPRLHELDLLLEGLSSALTVVEVGGTAGELEHRIISEALQRAFGPAALHVHLTAVIASPSGRVTTKPAQLSLAALAQRPDLVLVRGKVEDTGTLAPLHAVTGRSVPILVLEEDADWPERAVHRVLSATPTAELLQRTLGVKVRPDPLFDPSPSSGEASSTEVVVVHDGAGADGYASLAHRLRAWSGGTLRVRWQTGPDVPSNCRGVVRIGERMPPALRCPDDLPVLHIVPPEQGRPSRDAAARPDWEGTAEAPGGLVARFVSQVMSTRPRIMATSTETLAYTDPAFAALYLQASNQGELRDHAVLDELVARALPAGERLLCCRILDVGCGAGRWAARLVAAGVGEVVGVEPARPMAQAAAALGLERFRLIQERIETFMPDGVFDAILASMSLDHVEDLTLVLGRLASHLAPGGRLIVTTEHPLRTAPQDGLRWVEEPDGSRSGRLRDYNREGYRTFHWFGHPAPVRVYHRTVSTWMRLLREAGLEPIALHEPAASEPRDAGNPRFWMIVAERHGPRRSLVTVDGGAASGKTAFAEGLAKRLGWLLVDSGQLQRAFAWRWLAGRNGEPVRLSARGGHPHYYVGLEDVTQELHREGVLRACSSVAQDAAASTELAALLDEMTRENCVVTGRAMGRLFPTAVARFFLTAPTEIRASRRGCSPGEIAERDHQDMEKGRLLPPDIDAFVLDTSTQGADSLAATAAEIVCRRLGKGTSLDIALHRTSEQRGRRPSTS